MKDDYIDKLITQELNKSVEKLSISTELRNRIKAETIRKPRTPLDILRTFLNRKIEIPLLPIVAAAAIVVVITLTPFKGFRPITEHEKIVIPSQYKSINIGNVSIIIEKNSKGDGLHDNY